MTELRFLAKLGRYFPRSLSEVWDHPLYQCGKKDMKKEIRKVFLCLDYSEFCLEKVTEIKPDIIITHHPFYFGKRKEIREHDIRKAELEDKTAELLSCPIYSYHTCYDYALKGMNAVFDKEISLGKCYRNKDTYTLVLDHEMTASELVSYLKEKTAHDYQDIPITYFSQDENRKHQKISFILGGGASCYQEALEEGSTLFLSGDSKQNNRLEMRRYGLDYIEIPHECEEKYFLLGMKKAIAEIDPEIQVFTYSYMTYLK